MSFIALQGMFCVEYSSLWIALDKKKEMTLQGMFCVEYSSSWIALDKKKEMALHYVDRDC